MKLPFGEHFSRFWERVEQGLRVQVVETLGISSLLTRLSPRERFAVGSAAVALGLAVGYAFIIDPLWEMYAHLQARIATKEREVREIAALRQTYETLRREVEGLRPPQGPAPSPFAVLEGLATTTLGRDKLTAINPAGHETYEGVERETIELRLSGVSLQEVVTLLYKMDTAGSMLRCTNLTLKKRYKDPYTFDVALTAIAFTPR
jgi:type II secretory pathway component PulM